MAALAACGGGGNGGGVTTPPPATPFPISGTAVPGMASVDTVISTLMRKWAIPGGAVGIVKDGRLVYSRGFGYADAVARTEVAPDALFRIASLSKPVTAAAVLKLVEQGRLSLDAPAFALLPDITPLPGSTVDPRLASITVRHLLEHSGGWDRDATFDPMFRTTQAAQATNTPAPATASAVIRYMLGRPLDFTPGTRYAYSNFGYAVLGRIVERVSGTSYEQFVQQAVLAPAGARRMRLGRSLEADRAPGEVRYYDRSTLTSVYPGGGTVPAPYGGFSLEVMDAHGGWLASTVDLLRFATAVDGLPTRPDVLSAASIGLMTARPAAPLWAGSPVHYGLGWLVRPAEGNWWHDGSLPGTTAFLVRTGTGLAWVALFNARDMVPNTTFAAELDGAMWEAVRGVTAWPTHDLFPSFP
jgi:N-acyl-D-amino-acid deacylase